MSVCGRITFLGVLIAVTLWPPLFADDWTADLILEVRRDPETLAGGCQVGDLYLSEGVLDDLEQIGRTLEPPMGGDATHPKGLIPPGSYRGHVRVDGKKGWRIELEKVLGFKNVQIHVGNYPKNTMGCILVGTDSVEDECQVTGSKEALGSIREVFQSVGLESVADPPKRILVRIIND